MNKYKCQLQHLSRKITIARLGTDKHRAFRKGVGDQSTSQTEHASTMSHCCEKTCGTERCVNRTVISRTYEEILIFNTGKASAVILCSDLSSAFQEKFPSKKSSRSEYKEGKKTPKFLKDMTLIENRNA